MIEYCLIKGESNPHGPVGQNQKKLYTSFLQLILLTVSCVLLFPFRSHITIGTTNTIPRSREQQRLCDLRINFMAKRVSCADWSHRTSHDPAHRWASVGTPTDCEKDTYSPTQRILSATCVFKQRPPGVLWKNGDSMCFGLFCRNGQHTGVVMCGKVVPTCYADSLGANPDICLEIIASSSVPG